MTKDAKSIREVLRQLSLSESEFIQAMDAARRNLITYFPKSKLNTLFIKAIDNCEYVEFSSARDRRVDKSMPVYKVSIKYAKLPDDVRARATKRGSTADAKAAIVHMGVLTPYINLLLEVVNTNDMEYLKEPIPSKDVRESIAAYISSLYAIDTSDDPTKPLFVRQIF